MNKRTWICRGLFLVIVIITLIGCKGYLDYLDHWYEQVQADLARVKWKLAGLNHNTLESLPPPEGVVAIIPEPEELGLNIYYEYGIVTKMEYRIEDSDLDAVAYYRALFDKSRWTQIDSYSGGNYEFIKYAKDETCVEMMISSTMGEYYVYIHHDFQKQDFSPKLPPMWYVQGIREYGKTIIDNCPP